MSRSRTNPTKWPMTQPGHPYSLIRVFPVTQWEAKDPRFLHVDSKDSDQTGRTPRLIRVFAGRTVILLVLSCCSSNHKTLFVSPAVRHLSLNGPVSSLKDTMLNYNWWWFKLGLTTLVSIFSAITQTSHIVACPFHSAVSMKYHAPDTIWAKSWENLFMAYANNKDADQTVQVSRSLIHLFVVCCLYCIICLVAKPSIPWLYLASLAEQADLTHTWSKTPEDRFLLTRHILDNIYSCIPDNVFHDFHPFWIFPSYTRGCKMASCMTSGRCRCELNPTFLDWKCTYYSINLIK